MAEGQAGTRIELGGKTRTLRYDFNALVSFEEVMGFSVDIAFKNPGFKALRELVWAGLIWKEESLTPRQVGKMIDEEMGGGASFEDLLEPVQKALRNSNAVKDAIKQAEDDEETDGDDSKN